MPSIFYKNTYLHKFPVPLLSLERLEVLLDRGESSAVRRVIQECCGVSEPSVEDEEYFLSRVAEKYGDTTPVSTDGPKHKKHKEFGYALNEMLKGLPAEDQFVAAFGVAEATRLYCEADKETAVRALEVWQKLQTGRHLMMLEACAYAFGRGYDNKRNMVEVRADNENVVDAFQAMANMFNNTARMN